MQVIGIDPGSYATGYGLIISQNQTLKSIQHGVIRPKKTISSTNRISTIYTSITRTLKELTPDALALEKAFYSEHAQAALVLGEVRGTIIAAACQLNIPIFEYSPTQVKKAVVGYGHAEKSQIQQMIKMLLSLPKVPPKDAADALAIAICHANTTRSFT